MPQLTRITRDPAVMGGKPCIRGMRVTVGTVVGLVAAGRSRDEILREYPFLEAEDIAEAANWYSSETIRSISWRDARPSASTASATFSIVSGVISLTSPPIPAGCTMFICTCSNPFSINSRGKRGAMFAPPPRRYSVSG